MLINKLKLRQEIDASLPNNPLSLTVTQFVSSTGTSFAHIAPLDVLQNGDTAEETPCFTMDLWRILQREAQLVTQQGERFQWSQQTTLYVPGCLTAEEESQLRAASATQRQKTIQHILGIRMGPAN